jgi:nucleotide-binding universal stress UspA family protein
MAIVDRPDIEVGAAMGIGNSAFKRQRDGSLLADARVHAEDWLAQFQHHCDAEAVPAHTLEIVGRPAAAIIDEMQRHDLVVMGREVNFRFETEDDDRATRDRILRHADRPVILVPESTSDVEPTLGETVLLAYDGSAPAERALDSFARSGLGQSRDVHVATVGDDGEQAEDLATQAGAKLRALGIKATAHGIVSVLPISEALLKLGRELGAGFFVMGAFARSRLSVLLHGSHTRDLVEHSPVALCLQH